MVTFPTTDPQPDDSQWVLIAKMLLVLNGEGGSGSNWILATGFWDDDGVWDDDAVWID